MKGIFLKKAKEKNKEKSDLENFHAKLKARKSLKQLHQKGRKQK